MIWFGRNVSVLKTTRVNTAKNNECCYLLQYFQLDEAERSPMLLLPNPLAGTCNICSNSAMPPTD